MPETRSKQLNINITPTMHGQLEELAEKQHVSRSQVAFVMIHDGLQQVMPRCPHCGSYEIKRRDIHCGGSVIGESKCADCGTEVE